jgi:two-component system, LytTR family, response regulator
MKIRVLIADDEPWARKRIASLLRAEQDVEIVGQCSEGAAAIQQITELHPDLVFLDVQMPEVDGFEVVEAIGPGRMPLTIFATAYDKYALRAFDAHALDYLLKPFDEERFQKALERARRELLQDRAGLGHALASLLQSLRASGKFLQHMVVNSGGRVTFLKTAEIDWIEASNNYVTLHVGRDSHLLRSTMNALEPKLDSEQFVRIHRSAIVNLDRVKELQPWFRGEQVLILKDDTRLTVGRAFRIRLQKLLQNAVH